MKTKILLIEGKRADHPSFAPGLTKKGFLVDAVGSGSAAVDYLQENLPHLVIVDAASMRTSGRRICQSVHKVAAKMPILAILGESSENLDKMDADVILRQPFTLQKLVNRIRPLLPAEPKDLLQAGGVQLDLEQRRVICEERQTKLTPRLVALLKILMEHPGEVVGREDLFRQVWETEYTVDTRTLDVHVSWLRQAMEVDPRHPRFIKTVRGVGYRLDVEDQPRPVKKK